MKKDNFSDSQIEAILKNSLIEISQEELQNIYNNIIYTYSPVKSAIEKPYCCVTRILNDPDKVLQGLLYSDFGLALRQFMLLCTAGGDFLTMDGKYIYVKNMTGLSYTVLVMTV